VDARRTKPALDVIWLDIVGHFVSIKIGSNTIKRVEIMLGQRLPKRHNPQQKSFSLAHQSPQHHQTHQTHHDHRRPLKHNRPRHLQMAST
jgi:hypothetical protein